MKQSTSKNKSVVDILEKSDIELTGGWTNLASLVMAYEGIQWSDAGIKARQLLKVSRVPAIEYITDIRKKFVPTPKIKTEIPKKKLRREREFMNYRRLLKIVPDLDVMLLSGKHIYGKSIVTGYMDFHLELITQNKRGFYITISHYYKENGDMIPDPDMVIRVDVEHEYLEALTFQDRYTYQEVYDNYMNPKSVKPKAKTAQNSFLDTWLRNLIKQGHHIELEEEEEEAPVLEEITIEKETVPTLLDPSFMDEAIILEIKETAKNMILDDVIQMVLKNDKDGKSKIRPVTNYFFAKRINESPLGVKVPYPSQKELEDDYKKLVEELERNKVADDYVNNIDIDDSSIIETVKHWTKLAAVIQSVEGLDFEKAKDKALELKKSNQAENYVITAFKRKNVSGVNQLYKLNYQQLVRLIPNLIEGVIKDKSGIIKRKKADDPLRLKYEGMDSISSNIHVLSIQQVDEEGIQIIAIQRIVRKIWLLSRNGKFNGTSDYDHETANTDEKQKANKELSNWLKVMLHYGFEDIIKNSPKSEGFEHPVAKLLEKYPIVIEWSEGSPDENIGIESLEELKDKLKSFKYPKKKGQGYTKTKIWFRDYQWYIRIDLSKNEGDYYPNDMNLIEWLKKGDPNFDWEQFSKTKEGEIEHEHEWDEEANNKIPDFEVGKVKLVEAHIKVGLDQEDIDWINKNKLGRTITPVSNMKNKTKSFEADLAKKALSPGFRISKTGKLYRENRSNRSDLTDQGL